MRGGIRATLSDGEVLEADHLLCATGRHPNSEGLGLEELGVKKTANGAVVVDAYSNTSLPSIHAIGDVTDRINLTPVAIHEAICLVNTLFNDRPMAPVHEAVPAAVFSQPPLGTVGLTESEARARYGEIDVYRSTFRALKQTLTSSSNPVHDETRGGSRQRSRGGSSYGGCRSGRDRPGFCGGGSRGA